MEEKKKEGGKGFRKACKRVAAVFAVLSAILTFTGNLGPLCTKLGDDMFDAYRYGAAYRLYEAGAKLDNPDSEIRLAYMLRKGIYVKKDKSLAKYYEAQAHNHGLEIVPTMKPTPTPHPAATLEPVDTQDAASRTESSQEQLEIQEIAAKAEETPDTAKETGKQNTRKEEDQKEAQEKDGKTKREKTGPVSAAGAALYELLFLRHLVTIRVPFWNLELAIPLPYLFSSIIFLLGMFKIDSLAQAKPSVGKMVFEVLMSLSILYCIAFFIFLVPMMVLKVIFIAFFGICYLAIVSCLWGDMGGYLEGKKKEREEGRTQGNLPRRRL